MSKCPEDQKRRAIAAAIATGNASAAAREHGVSRTQLREWLKDGKLPEVAAARGAAAKFHGEIMAMLRATCRKLRARVRSEDLSAPGLASVASVLSAIAKAWAPRRDPNEDEDGVTTTIIVRRGGSRVRAGVEVDSVADGTTCSRCGLVARLCACAARPAPEPPPAPPPPPKVRIEGGGFL